MLFPVEPLDEPNLPGEPVDAETVEVVKDPRRPDPTPPEDRPLVGPDMATPEEVVGMAGGRDPLRPRTQREKTSIADAFDSSGLEYL